MKKRGVLVFVAASALMLPSAASGQVVDPLETVGKTVDAVKRAAPKVVAPRETERRPQQQAEPSAAPQRSAPAPAPALSAPAPAAPRAKVRAQAAAPVARKAQEDRSGGGGGHATPEAAQESGGSAAPEVQTFSGDAAVQPEGSAVQGNGRLPFTGFSVMPLLALGVAALLAGFWLRLRPRIY
jgi:hypothetical protein